MGLVTVAWLFGSVWVTVISGAPVALFAHHLGASRFEFGLLSALPFIASLASLPASWLTERTGARKRIFLFGMYTQRLLWVPIALAPVWIVARYGMEAAPTAMTLFLILVFIMHVGGAVGGPAWMSWMADVVPERVRGKYFSRRRQWGILSAIPAALLAGWLLDRSTGSSAVVDPYRMLRWCAILFLCATVFGVADIAFFHAVPQRRVAPRPTVPFRQLFLGPLRNPQFLWFGGFVATLVFAISFMGQFVTLYCIEKVGVTNIGVQLMLLVAPMLAQLIVLPVWGKAADRLGKKPVLVLASLGLVPVGLGWCLMNSGAVWLGYGLSALGAAFWTGIEVANLNLVLEFSGSSDSREGGSSYVAVNSVIINVAGCLGGLASGIIAQSLGGWSYVTGLPFIGPITFYEVLFALSGFLRLLAVVVFLPHLHEQDAAPTREALRFMTANIYNNLFTAVFQPIRYLKLRSGAVAEAKADPLPAPRPAPLKRAA